MLSNIPNVARYRVHANATAVNDPCLCVFIFILYVNYRQQWRATMMVFVVGGGRGG